MAEPIIPLSAVRPFGRGLVRPECVVATRDGSVFVPDYRGGVTRLCPDGRQEDLRPPSLSSLRPNSLTIERQCSFVLAHLDDYGGGVIRLYPDGRHEPVLLAYEGRPLPSTNFVLADGDDLWITVSTRLMPRWHSRRPGYGDGYVLRMRNGNVKLVVDGIGFTNEVRVDAERRWLYIVETFQRRIARCEILRDGLGPKEIFVDLGPGHYPDGFAFDAEGSLWVTSIFSNRVLKITPDREVIVMIADGDPHFTAEIDRQWETGEMGRAPTEGVLPRTLGNVSSVAFGGPDLRTLYLGALLIDRIHVTEAPVPGLAMPHWDIEVPAFSA